MKLIITIAFIVFCLKSHAQTDSTKLLNVNLQARVIEYLAGNIASPDNEENFGVFLKWRTLFRANQPAATTVITTDTLPVNTAVYLYNWALSNQEGFGFGVAFRTLLSSYRQSNSNLDRQMTAIENAFVNQLIVTRINGRRLLLGK